MRVRNRPRPDEPRRVWLTFDDGPYPENTAMVLDALKMHGIHATFFVVGEMAHYHGKELLPRIHDEGHGIGNHSYDHPKLADLTEDQVRDQLSRTDELIARYHGESKLFRPPYGNYNKTVLKVARDLAYQPILWNVDPEDWNSDNQPDAWIPKALDLIRNQHESVVLLHDLVRTTAEHVNLFIRQIHKLGPVTFEEPTTLARTEASKDNRPDRPMISND